MKSYHDRIKSYDGTKLNTRSEIWHVICLIYSGGAYEIMWAVSELVARVMVTQRRFGQRPWGDSGPSYVKIDIHGHIQQWNENMLNAITLSSHEAVSSTALDS